MSQLPKNILLVGGRTKAKSLATSLLEQGFKVTIVNKDARDCAVLAEETGFNVFHGDGTKPFVLEDVGASQMDMVIALTSKDEDNLVICELCKKRFQVPKTVALVIDPQKMEFFRAMGIDSTVCAVTTITNVIEQQALVEEITGAVSVGNGRIRIVELSIKEGDYALHKQVRDLGLPSEVILGTILRGAGTVIPHGDTKILLHDQLVILTTAKQEAKAIAVLKGGKHD